MFDQSITECPNEEEEGDEDKEERVEVELLREGGTSRCCAQDLLSHVSDQPDIDCCCEVARDVSIALEMCM